MYGISARPPTRSQSGRAIASFNQGLSSWRPDPNRRSRRAAPPGSTNSPAGLTQSARESSADAATRQRAAPNTTANSPQKAISMSSIYLRVPLRTLRVLVDGSRQRLYSLMWWRGQSEASRERMPSTKGRPPGRAEAACSRAIQWMVDPVSDGGLGLDPATVAEMVGHDHGGYLIATVYTKLVSWWFNSFAVRVGVGHAYSYCCFD
jgi:hypothetical protein